MADTFRSQIKQGISFVHFSLLHDMRRRGGEEDPGRIFNVSKEVES